MFPSWPFYLNFIKFLDQYNPMPISPMQNIEYRCCVLCGKKRVAPINRNPLRYSKYGACPTCRRLNDFEEQMKRYKEKAKTLRYVNTSTP